jgi:glutamine synthetase
VPAFNPLNGKEARVEFRCPDPLCNPYLTYTVAFQAGMDGIRKKIDPGDPVEANIYHLTDEERKNCGVRILPTSLDEALDEWKSDEICIRALGTRVSSKYAELKMQECKEYQPHVPTDRIEVTSWERQKYLCA